MLVFVGVPPFDVLIVAALFEELTALLAVEHAALGAWEEASAPDGLSYFHRTFRADDGSTLRIAAATSGAMGEAAAATRATLLAQHLSPRAIAMCGICAGDREDVFLGDIIVADRIYSYDHGKLVAAKDEGGKREETFFHDIETYNLDPSWRLDVAFLSQDEAVRQKLGALRPPSRRSQEAWLLHALFSYESGAGPLPMDHPERKRRCPAWTTVLRRLKDARLVLQEGGTISLTALGRERAAEERSLYPDGPLEDPPFRIHVGPIATGKTVQQDPDLFRRLEKFARKTIGVEMEAAAIGYVASHLDRRAIVMKAVSDYADHEKDDSYRQFAARASAELLVRFFCRRAARAEEPRTSSRRLEPPRAAPSRPTALKMPLGDNPFHTAGALDPGHPTYIRRAADASLTKALANEPLVVIEGDFRIGKSSLLVRTHAVLARAGAASYVDLSGLRGDDLTLFLNGFFRQVSREIGRSIADFADLEAEARGRMLTLALDELGHLGPSVLKSFVPSLYRLARAPHAQGARVRIMACLPGRIREFLREAGLDNPKYGQGFFSVVVAPLEEAGILRLLSFLSPRARALAEERVETITTRSRGYPHAIQRLCFDLYELERDEEADALLCETIESGAWDE